MIKKYESYVGKSAIIYHGYWGGADEDDHPDSPDDRLELLDSHGVSATCDIINYDREWALDKCKSLFEREAEKCKNVDVLIGFSLGGYMAFKLAGYLSKDVILVNPAIDRSITKLHIKEFNAPKSMNFGNMEVYLGEKDTLIDKEVTLRYLKKNGIKCESWIVGGMQHGTSLWQFNKIIENSKILK